jgi:hypothetical protein
VHALDLALCCASSASSGHGGFDLVGLVVFAREQELLLDVGRGIPDRSAHEEAIELAVGQRVGAGVVVGVLRRDHEEKARRAGA